MYAHPTNKIGRYERGLQAGHEGVDISHSQETPILAVDKGTIEKVANQPAGYGNYIVIRHNNQETTLYAHLDRIFVTEGQQIQKGNAIGVMGNTGNSTGRHLHFEYRKNGKIENPNNILDNSTTTAYLYDKMPDLPSTKNILFWVCLLILSYFLIKNIF